MRLDGVLLLAAARDREISHQRAAMVKRGVEQARDALALGAIVALRTRCALRLNRERQPIQELPHAGREAGRELLEGRGYIVPERRRRQTFHERPAEIQRAELRKRESG